MLSHLRLQCKFANVRLFRGLSALPAPCPYRAEQATGLAGGYDYTQGGEALYGFALDGDGADPKDI